MPMLLVAQILSVEIVLVEFHLLSFMQVGRNGGICIRRRNPPFLISGDGRQAEPLCLKFICLPSPKDADTEGTRHRHPKSFWREAAFPPPLIASVSYSAAVLAAARSFSPP